MKIYELINTVNEEDNGRYFFVNLFMAQLFQKANNEYSIAVRETLDNIINQQSTELKEIE